MRDAVSETFGYIVLVAAVVLFVWENIQYRNRDEQDLWLLTGRRYRRRAVISAVLGFIGVLIVIESRGLINVYEVVPFTIYVFSLTGLAIFLLVLAAIDLLDTARNAQKRTLHDLEESVQAPPEAVNGEPSPSNRSMNAD